MKVLSLFSGVGGFDLGLEAAGMETVALCEWDKKAASVLRRHWPHIPIYGDVSDLTGTQLLADGVHPDLVAFGSPCQDLSVAGKRAGLAGERSGLFHEAIRIIRELRDLTAGALPRWVIWENVVGALNSNGGADFQAVLNEMGNLGAVFSEWAVLDAQNFGVAQRRRRVFLVSCLDPGAARGCPDPLLPVREGGPRDLVPLRAAWKNATGRSSGGARGRDFAARALGFGGYTIDDRTGTLKTRGNHADIDYALIDGTRVGNVRLYEEPVQTLVSRMGSGGNNVPLVMREPVGFSHTQGLDAQPSEDHFPTLRREGGGHAVAQPVTEPIPLDLRNALRAPEGPQGVGIGNVGDPSPTLTTVYVPGVAQPIAFTTNQRAEVRDLGDAASSLSASSGTNQTNYVAQPFTKAKRAQSTEDNETWVDGEVAPTLNLMDNTGDTRATVLSTYTQLIAFSVKDNGADAGEIAPTIRAGNSHHSNQGGGNPPAVALWWNGEDTADTLTTSSNEQRMPDKGRLQAVVTPYAVRRLLPIECERLMGWPDDWTRWDADGKEQADSHRYKQCGNGVASPVAAWVGRHIFAQDAIGRSLK